MEGWSSTIHPLLLNHASPLAVSDALSEQSVPEGHFHDVFMDAPYISLDCGCNTH